MKSSFVELDGKEKHRLIQFINVKVAMEGKSKGESVEEMLEAIDISGCMNGNYDAIVLSRLLNILLMYYNIPLESKLKNI